MENKLICYVFASRSRPDKFFACLDRIAELSSSSAYYVLAKLDVDDVYMHNSSAIERLKGYTEVIIQWGNSYSKIHAINRNLDAMREDTAIIVNMSDDIEWIKHGFDNVIRAHCGPDDFVLFPEEFADGQVVKGKNERIAIVSVMGIDYYKRFNYIYHPDYQSLWCDNEATAVARILGRLKEVEIPLFDHRHPAAGKAVRDDQYVHTESFYRRDEKVFNKRKAKNFGL